MPVEIAIPLPCSWSPARRGKSIRLFAHFTDPSLSHAAAGNTACLPAGCLTTPVAFAAGRLESLARTDRQAFARTAITPCGGGCLLHLCWRSTRRPWLQPPDPGWCQTRNRHQRNDLSDIASPPGGSIGIWRQHFGVLGWGWQYVSNPPSRLSRYFIRASIAFWVSTDSPAFCLSTAS